MGLQNTPFANCLIRGHTNHFDASKIQNVTQDLMLTPQPIHCQKGLEMIIIKYSKISMKINFSQLFYKFSAYKIHVTLKFKKVANS